MLVVHVRWWYQVQWSDGRCQKCIRKIVCNQWQWLSVASEPVQFAGFSQGPVATSSRYQCYQMGSELTNNLQAWLSREKQSRFVVSCPLINVATIASCVLVTWSGTSKHVVNLLTVIVSTEKQKMNDTINSLTEIGWLCFHLVSLCV